MGLNSVGDFLSQGTCSSAGCEEASVEGLPRAPCICVRLVRGYPLAENLSGEVRGQSRPY